MLLIIPGTILTSIANHHRAESMARESLGEFEHQVLLTILRLGKESYSVPMVLELEKCTGRSVAPAAVYIALRRLEKKGLVASRMVESDVSGESHPRRYFALRPPALDRLKESRNAFDRLWDGLDPVFGR